MADPPKSQLPAKDDGNMSTTFRITFWTKTLSVCCCYYAMGCGNAILGPTLVEMEILFGTDTAGISWAVFAQTFGAILGSLLCGLTLDRMQPEILMMIACIVEAFAMMSAPFTGNIFGFLVVTCIMGIGVGYLDTCCPPYFLNLWKDEQRKDQAMHGMYIVGKMAQFLTTLIIRQFLTHESIPKKQTNSTELNTHKWNNITLDQYHVSTTEYTSKEEYNERVKDNLTVQYAYVTTAMFSIFSSIILVITIFLSSKACICLTRKKHKSRKEMSSTAKEESKSEKQIYLLLSLMMFCLSWTFFTPGNYLSTFSVKGLGMSAKTGSDITSVSFFSNIASIILIIILTQFVKSEKLLLLSILFSLSGWTTGLFIPSVTRLIWLTSVLNGFGIGPFIFCFLLWLSEYKTITGKMTSIYTISLYTGGVVSPLLIGYLFDLKSHMWVIYLPFIFACLQLVLYIAFKCSVLKLSADTDQTDIHEHELQVTKL